MPRRQTPRRPARGSARRRNSKAPIETRLIKSCIAALGAAGILMFSFVTVGMALEVGPAGLYRMIQPDAPRTVITAPIAVDLSGYSLDPEKRDHYVWVSVAMKVPGPHQEAEICRMMPRLRSAVIQTLGDRLRTSRNVSGPAAPDLINFARTQISQALETDLDREFGLLVLEDWRGAPKTSCPRAPREEL